MKLYPRLQKTSKGVLLIYIIVIIALFSIVMLPLLQIVSTKLQTLKGTNNREEALQIADAGINYYQWHLAHFPSDYQDGTGQAGPYIHSYTDYDTQKVIGQFSLTITPPTTGSTIVTIKSTGWTTANPTLQRTITARYGVPSIAKYAFLSNDVIWIGNSETVSGQLQSNNGVRFDGIGNAPIQSALSTYTCPSGQGSPCPATENGVWGAGSSSFWQFPVPAIDFSSLTADLATIKSAAQSAGIYLPPSNKQGYSLVFNSNGTVSIYKVNSLRSNPTGWDTSGTAHNEDTDYNNTSSGSCPGGIGGSSCGRTLQSTQAIPANGLIYIEDKTWVEGTVNGRVTVAAAALPYNSATAPTIYIPNNLTYAAKDGTNVLGLIAQKDIVVTYHAPNTLEVDGAMISQNGAAQFLYYPNDIKTTITIFGSVMTYNQWTWTWVDSNNNTVSGYNTTNDSYDSNLLYAPPPSFPFSSSNYQQLSWISN